MSEFKVEVVTVGRLEPHPNADTLSVTKVHGYPVIVKNGSFQEGDRAVYVPVDAMVPTANPVFAFMGEREYERVKAKRLRGTFSMGLLVPVPQERREDEDLAFYMGIKKYEPPEDISTGGETEPCPEFFPKYTDIEGLRRWPDVIQEGEPVVLTEKIHGTNARFLYQEGRLWVGSHTTVKKLGGGNVWCKTAERLDLQRKLQDTPGFVFYGEIYGWVQDLRYGMRQGQTDFRVFDVLRTENRTYLDYEDAANLCAHLGLLMVPHLIEGPWRSHWPEIAEGWTTLWDGKQVREGFVVKPLKERWDDRIGRVILKMPGEGYLTRKEK